VLAESPGGVTLRFFFDRIDPNENWSRAFRAAFPAAAAPYRVAARERPVEDWGEGWRVHFAPTPVGSSLLVCPPWLEPAAGALGGRTALLIDPGQGFGTGGHPSTVLALELLEAALRARPAPGRMLDVGVGSGILAIAARLLGVAEPYGLDLDGRVMAEVRRNWALNGLGARPRLVRGGPECLRGAFPLVAANLTAPVLLEQRKALAGLTAPAGWLILSGILARERKKILRAFGREGLLLEENRALEDWVAFRFQRPP
jgi:ribosomal protein L11 methyltransferase